MKKIFVTLAALLLILSLTACGKQSSRDETLPAGQKLFHTEITVKGYGTVKLELDAERNRASTTASPSTALLTAS